MPDNLVHGSDSPESAEREIGLWFAAMTSLTVANMSVNVALWTRRREPREGASSSRGAEEITYGIWNVPESSSTRSPDVVGKDVVELGCGTAYFGAWLKKAARRGSSGRSDAGAAGEGATL